MAEMNLDIVVDDSEALRSFEDLEDAVDEIGDEATQTARRVDKAFDRMSMASKAFARGARKAGKASVKALKGTKRAAELTAKALRGVTSAMTGPAGIIAGFLGVGAAIETFNNLLEEGRGIRQLHVNTGIAIDSLERMRNIIALNGGEFDNFKDVLNDFTEKLGDARNGNDELSETLLSLGVNLTGPVDNAFQQTIKGLANTADHTERMRKGIIVFGDAFKETLSTTVGQGLDEFESRMEEANKMTIFNERAAVQFEALGEVITRTTNKFKQLFSAVIQAGGADVIGGISDFLTQKMTSLIDKADTLGDTFKEWTINAIKGVGSLIKGFNIVYGAINRVATVLAGLFKTVKVDGKRVNVFAHAMGQTFDAVAESISNSFTRMVANIKIQLGKIRGSFEVFGQTVEIDPFSGLREQGQKTLDGLEEDSRGLGDRLSEIWSSFGDNSGITKGFQDITLSTSKSIDGVDATINQLISSINNFTLTAQNSLNTMTDYDGALDKLAKNWGFLAGVVPKGAVQLKDFARTAEEVQEQLSGFTIDIPKLDKHGFFITRKDVDAFRSAVDDIDIQYQDLMTRMGQAEQENQARLKAELDAGVLTHEQYEKDKLRITQQFASARQDIDSEVQAARSEAGGAKTTFESIFGESPEQVVATTIDFGQQLVNTTGQIMDSVFSIQQQASQREISLFEKTRRAEIDGLLISDRRKKKMFDQLEKEMEKKRKKAFEEKKKSDMAQAGINMASGILGAWSGAFASGAPTPEAIIMGGIASAIMTAVGVAQIAAISAQEYYANGGVVGGIKGASMGPDNRTVGVRDGEMILNARQQGDLFDAINKGQTAGGTFAPTITSGDIIVQGSASDDTIEQIRQIKDEQTMQLRDTIYNLYMSNELDFIGV